MNLHDEMNCKRGRIAAVLADEGVQCALMTRRCNFSWFTAGAHNHVAMATDTGLATIVVDAAGAKILTTNIEAERLRGEGLDGREIEVIDYPWHDDDAKAAAMAKAVGGRKAVADAPVPGVEAGPWPAALDRLRWTLCEAEIERYRLLAADAATAVEHVAQTVEPGATENELAGMLHAVLLQSGCLPWVCLVAGEDRLPKYRHPLPTDAPVNKYCMLVACAERHGLITALTRLFYFGKIPAELAAKQRAVVTVDATLIDATRPGAALGDIFQAGLDAYAAVGHGEQWRLHHQGGSTGYLGRELVATPGEATAAMANQAFAWNPSITGVKSEDTILCTDDGPEILSATDDWPVFDVEVNGTVYHRPDILAR